MTLADKVTQFGQDADTVNAIVHGPATGTGSTVPTAAGMVRTFAKMDADLNANGNVAAVLAARVAAEAARDAANTTGKVFTTTAAGIAATADGQTFALLDSSLQFWIVYKNNAGAALEVARSYTKAYFDSFVVDLGDTIDPSYVPLVYDAAGKVAVWLKDGKLGAIGIGPVLMAAMVADATFLASVRAAITGDAATLSTLGINLAPSLGMVDLGATIDPSYLPLFVDSAGNVALWLKDGKLGAIGIGPVLMAALTSDATFLSAVRSAVSSDPATLTAVTNAVTPTLPFVDATGAGSAWLPLFADEAGNVPVWLNAGRLDALGLGPVLTAAIASAVAASLAGTRYAPLAGPSSSPRCISTDGRSLYAWRSKLAKTTRGVTVAQAKVVFMGDSWTEKVAIPQALADLLYANYGGKSGEGWIGLFDESPINGVTVAASGWTRYDGSDTVAPTLGCGFDGKAYSATGSAATYSLANLTTTNLDIYYRKGDGTFRYRVDGGAWTVVAGDGSNAVGKASIAGLANAAHNFDIDLTGNTGTAVLYGFRATRPTVTGVELSKAGNGSLTAKDLSLYVAANVAPFMADILPDLVIVILGTNDYRLGEDTASAYVATLTTLVAQVKSASPNTGFVFIAPADSNAAAVYPLTTYRDALYEFCVTNGHEFYNMNEDWAAYGTMNGLGMWADALHVNADGAQLLARRLHTRILSL